MKAIVAVERQASLSLEVLVIGERRLVINCTLLHGGSRQPERRCGQAYGKCGPYQGFGRGSSEQQGGQPLESRTSPLGGCTYAPDLDGLQ